MNNMTTVKVQKNQIIAKQKDKVRKWFIILEGAVVQRNSYARIVLGKDAVIGISEGDWYLCDYIAGKDSVLAVFPYRSAEDLKNAIQGQASMRGVLLRAALNQRQLLLKTYAGYYNLARQFHSFVENQYNEYTNLSGKYRLEGQSFPRIDSFKPLEMVHRAEKWEVNNSASLMQGYLEEYLQLMQKDDSLCIGAIMETSFQTRRVTQGIIEMVEYLRYNQDILLAESGEDLFHLYFDLLLAAEQKNYDPKPVRDGLDKMVDVIRKLNIYGEKLVSERVLEYQNHEYTPSPNGYVTPEEVDIWNEEAANKTIKNSLEQILAFAGLKEKEAAEVGGLLENYRNLPDFLSTDGEAHQLRRKLTQIFYELYQKIFMRVMKEGKEPELVVQMFLNFGYLDPQLAGEENASALYELTSHLDVCSTDRVYTIFGWLKSIYEGRNEPSRNEFDLDYPGYLAEMKKNGDLTADQVKAYMDSREMKAKFEMQNMFMSGNRATYGKFSTFCPILCEYDLINSIDKMLVTAQRLDAALDGIRQIDYSVFYRETMFSDPDKGINREMLMNEVLPDIILMPNAGTRAMMWQETAGIRRDTSARFMFPIFTAVDIDDMMVETVGRFRWEICRKIQGVHWNDIRDKSLTSEYCDYIQFYKKNSELSPDAKDKVKTALQRGRNNYREVFVKDYEGWIKFESKGSFRLNKVARQILVTYCPFTKPIREELKANPMYQNAIQRYELQNAKKAQRIAGVYDKYQKAGGKITKELQDNLDFYDM